ncbi:MAG: Ppx/GppA family phosphatase [Euzebyaceae bacterium]|nr:Ppx/GppA family phosphatase [Euzebyaceae bacterium]
MRIAALDLGSNSFHLLVADAGPDGTLTPVLRDKTMLRLGDVVAKNGAITGSAADEAVATVRRYRALADAAGASEMVTCATSAMREANNCAALVQRMADEAGVTVRVIDGDEEARLIFAAVRASVVLEPAPAVCLDLGGGSLEVSVGDVKGQRWAVSLPLGVGRLTAELVHSDPARKGDLRRLRNRVTEALEPVAAEVASHNPGLAVGTSGTLTDLAVAALTKATGIQPTVTNQLEVSRKQLEALHSDLIAMTTAEREQVVGLESRRAPLAIAGSTVALTALALLGLDRLVIGTWALREGMVLDTLARHHPVDRHDDPRAIRDASVLALARRYSWPEDHSRLVAGMARTLFDATSGLHGLDDDQRQLLTHAALLHDIGAHVSAEDQASHSAYLITHGRLRGFDPDETAVLACLARYHHKGEPGEGFAPFDRLPARRRKTLPPLVALLQVAHGLDRGRTGAVTGLAVTVTDEAVRLAVATARTTDGELERWGAQRATKRVERAFGRKLIISESAEVRT